MLYPTLVLCFADAIAAHPHPAHGFSLIRRGREPIMANSKPLMPNLILDYLGSKPQHKKHAWGLDLITDEEVKLIEETSKFDEVTTEEEDWEIVNFIPDSVAEESTRVLTSPFSHRKSDVDGSAKSADQSKFITQEDYEPPAGGDHLAELLQRQLQREIEHSHSLGSNAWPQGL